MNRLRGHDAVVATLPRGHYLVPTSFTARILAVEGMTVALEVETARLPDRVPNARVVWGDRRWGRAPAPDWVDNREAVVCSRF